MNIIKEFAGLSFFLVIALLVILVITGWFRNIYKLTQCDFEAPYKAEVVHSVGTVIPVVGAVAGWLDGWQSNPIIPLIRKKFSG